MWIRGNKKNIMKKSLSTIFLGKSKEDSENHKKQYTPPSVSVMRIEMECGIAVNSAAVSPVTIGGKADQVQTDWTVNDESTINAPFWN